MKKILLYIVLGFIAIQLIPIDRTNKPIDKKVNFVEINQTPENVKTLLKNGCYDCHSNETNYPKYAYIAPISWSIKYHINKGREYLNFSEWGTYNQDQKNTAIDDCIDNIENEEMPLKGYIPLHPKANFSKADRQVLVTYFKGFRKK